MLGLLTPNITMRIRKCIISERIGGFGGDAYCNDQHMIHQ
jgi:hypothetical protein